MLSAPSSPNSFDQDFRPTSYEYKFFTLLLFAKYAKCFLTSPYSIMGPSLEYLIDYQIMMG